MLICDAQVHAPNTPHQGHVHGMDGGDLLAAMDGAGVDRAMIVPLAGPGETADNVPALTLAQAHPDRFRVMGLVPLDQRDRVVREIPGWRAVPGLLGIRIPFVREPYRGLLARDEVDWLWAAAEAARVPVMLNAPGQLHKLARIAERHPALPLAIDHFGLQPYETFDAAGLLAAARELATLAVHPNVSVKASAMPCSVTEGFPFPSLHEPIRRAFDAFGPRRLFWGSDLTRLPCTYREALALFTEELGFLTAADRDWILGRGLLEWSGWS